MRTKLSTITTSRTDARLGFQIHLLVFVVSTPIIWAIWYITDTTYPWPLWSTPAWAIGLFFHYQGAFVFKRKEYKNW